MYFTCMFEWEQLRRVWLGATQLHLSAVTHREAPGKGGSCRVPGEPHSHEEWTARRRWPGVVMKNLPLNERRAITGRDILNISPLWQCSTRLNITHHTILPRWMQITSSNISRTITAQSPLLALCSTLLNTTHLRTNLNAPSSWNTKNIQEKDKCGSLEGAVLINSYQPLEQAEWAG